jgi:transcription elongation GreA/GreB family factor
VVEHIKLLAVTKVEAELLMDAISVSSPTTRTLALKAAGVVLEFAAEDELIAVEHLMDQATECARIGGQ